MGFAPMLDVAFGEANSSQATVALLAQLRALDLHGTLYLGYPLLHTADTRVQVDALLTCEELGVVAFDLSSRGALIEDEWLEQLSQLHSDMFVGLENKLKDHRELRKGRNLAFEIHTLTLAPSLPSGSSPNDVMIATPASLASTIRDFAPLQEGVLRHINAVIQTTTTMKPRKKRANVARQFSRGALLKEVEKQIANLDRWQKKAAIEYPDGPQRIRGLAGSGKTIVLAQKAALLHAKHAEWSIIVTFNTRSLYQQFRSLIRRFYFELTRGDDPDWSRLRIIHAWGSSSTPGVYAEIARSNGRSSRDFSYARERYGTGLAFSGVCTELLGEIGVEEAAQLYDAVLIDEAQDFPQEFFQLLYGATRPPKRIVWAYDELQNLGDYTMPPAEVIFGLDREKRPRVRLENRIDQPQQDIILRVCYRNSPWALATAHALGFGVYRPEGLVQMFDEVDLWKDIGYEVADGTLALGSPVTLCRSADASPEFWLRSMAPADAIQTMMFEDQGAECAWVAGEIRRNVDSDELEADDILIIVADPLATKSRGAALMRALQAVGLNSHVAGITASRDVLFYEDSIAITSIHRAKRNEAPMVYVVGAESCYVGWDLSRKRNILFTAVTRSRGWVRISGTGAHMEFLRGEIDAVRQNEFALRFTYPTEDQIKKMKRIHRDRSETEKAAINRDVEGVERLLRLVEEGEIAPEALPERIQGLIRAALGR
jgi:superfamily I DNA and RNA helicase